VPSVSFSRRTEEWVVRGERRGSGASGELVLVQEDLPVVTASDLKNALASDRDFYEIDRGYASVSELPEEYFEPEGPVGPIGFEVVNDDLIVTARCTAAWPDSGDGADLDAVALERVRRLVEPLLKQSRSALAHIDINDSWTDHEFVAIDLHIATPRTGRSVADLFRIGENVLRLCEAFARAQVTRRTVADLVRGGGAHLLIDQPEGNWLDAKSQEYDLSTTKGKINLAQAVARFANAEDGGLIVFGAKAKKVPGGEVIRQVRGVTPRYNDTAARYLKVLDRHVYPPPYGMRIDLVPTNHELALIVIEVPPQPEEFKPFLVHGAITADGDTEGAFISIVQRRGEGSIPITAPMIHASIAAGRALLRGQATRGPGER
jgi:Schlafen, AlbA_2